MIINFENAASHKHVVHTANMLCIRQTVYEWLDQNNWVLSKIG